MSGIRVKETMEQIRIPEEMQEEIIRNVRKQMENRKRNSWKRYIPRKKIPAIAVFALMAGLVCIPVQAIVRNLVTARMEELPETEIRDIAQLIQEQNVEADSFSREYSEEEKARMKELLQLYQNGMFPEKTILLADHEDEAAEGTLCYIWNVGLFCLPDRELTNEELLEIIDFNQTRSYAIAQSTEGQEARKEYQEKQTRLQEQVQAEDGIGRAEAVEIAVNWMKTELSAAAGGEEGIHVVLEDISETDYDRKSDVAYFVVFTNSKTHGLYTCRIDSADGKILDTEKHEWQDS